MSFESECQAENKGKCGRRNNRKHDDLEDELLQVDILYNTMILENLRMFAVTTGIGLLFYAGLSPFASRWAVS